MPWYAVRIEHPDGDVSKTLFTVEDMTPGMELIAFDSTPAVLAILEAKDSGTAAFSAWEKGKKAMKERENVECATIDELLNAIKGAELKPLLGATPKSQKVETSSDTTNQ